MINLMARGELVNIIVATMEELNANPVPIDTVWHVARGRMSSKTFKAEMLSLVDDNVIALGPDGVEFIGGKR